VLDPESLEHYWLPNDCGAEYTAIVYFVTFIIVGNYMVVNLFVAVILDNYAYMANVGDAELNEFVLEKFKKTWYRFTLKDKHATTHLGKYLRVAKLREFLDSLGAPLGVVIWDEEGNKKYKTLREEVRRHAAPGVGIGYRKLQYILCIAAMAVDPACAMPLEEQEARDDEMKELQKKKAAIVLQSTYRGLKGRSALGVTKGPSKSESEQKAQSFKKKFAEMMKNPAANSTQKALPPPSAPKAPVAAAPVSTDLGPGVQPSTDNKDEAAAAEVRNVFRERAAARAKAREAKGV